jgi:hypothetical protein
MKALLFDGQALSAIVNGSYSAFFVLWICAVMIK